MSEEKEESLPLFYSKFRTKGERLRAVVDMHRSSGSQSQLCDRYTPILADWDKAISDSDLLAPSIEDFREFSEKRKVISS